MKNIIIVKNTNETYIMTPNPRKDNDLTWRIVRLSDGLYRVHCANWIYDRSISDMTTAKKAWQAIYSAMRYIIRERRKERRAK